VAHRLLVDGHVDQQRLDDVEALARAADHEGGAVPPREVGDAAAGADVEEVDAALGDPVVPLLGVLPEGVAAVGDDVARLERRQDLLEVLVDGLAVRHPHQDHAGRRQLARHVLQVLDRTHPAVSACSRAESWASQATISWPRSTASSPRLRPIRPSPTLPNFMPFPSPRVQVLAVRLPTRMSGGRQRSLGLPNGRTRRLVCPLAREGRARPRCWLCPGAPGTGCAADPMRSAQAYGPAPAVTVPATAASWPETRRSDTARSLRARGCRDAAPLSHAGPFRGPEGHPGRSRRLASHPSDRV